MGRSFVCCAGVVFAVGSTACSDHSNGPAAVSLSPANMSRTGAIDERFQAYNVEMVEVIGGRFWKSYKDNSAPKSYAGANPAGMDPGLYQQRPPIDLSNSRLRKLARALGPAYMRVSGTWANTVYFHNSERPAPKSPRKWFGGILTRQQWKGVVDVH